MKDSRSVRSSRPLLISSALAAIMSVGSLSIGASTAHASGRVLTLDEAFTLARRQNHDLKAARSRVDQAEAGVISATAALLPKASVQLKYTRNYKEAKLDLSSQLLPITTLAGILAATTDNPAQAGALQQYQAQLNATSIQSIVIQKANQVDFQLGAQIPLIVPSAYPALQAAKRNVEAQQLGFAATEQALLAGVAQAFYAAAGVDELVEARQNAVKVAEQTLKNAKARFEAGTVNRVEVTRAELAVVRAEQTLNETRDLQKNAYQALGTLLELEGDFRVDPKDASLQLGAGAVDDLIGEAQRNRQELRMLDASIGAGKLQAQSALLSWVPSVSAFGALRAFNYRGFVGDPYQWLVGVQLDWQFDGGYSYAQRRLAQAQVREGQERRKQLDRSISDEVRTAVRALPTKRRAVEAAQRAVALSQETLNLVRVQHDAGTATQLDLLQAQDMLVLAEVGLAQARFDVASAQVQVARTLGKLGGK